MSDSTTAPGIVPILPCRDIDESTGFYRRLGLAVVGDYDVYRLMEAPGGFRLHLQVDTEKKIDPLHNPNGLYIYVEDVDALAAKLDDRIVGSAKPEDKPWGMYEFAVSDPDGTLVRIGRPSAR